MIYQLGVILVVGLIYTSSPNEQYPTYAFKSHFTNSQVLPSTNIFYSTDEDDYRLVVDLGVDFDVYYNADNTNYMVDNFVVTTGLEFYTNYGGNYSDNLALAYTITYTHTGSLYSTDLEDMNIYVEWALRNEDDRVAWSIGWNSAPNVTQYRDILYASDEEITGTYGIAYNLHFTNVTSTLYEYVSRGGDYTEGYQNGYSDGYTEGQGLGYEDGYQTGYTNGESVGYASGFNAGVSVDDTAIVIFNGILNIALVPINFFLAIFNFEILGINMSALVSSLLSICLIIIVVRFVTGKKQGGD